MTPELLDQHGILLRRDAIRRGFDDDWLARQRRAGTLVRMRHGAYVDAGVWGRATRAQRHDLTSRAVMRWYDDRVALSHVSNIVRRGGPDWGLDLTNVHLTNLFGHGDRTKAGIVHHRGTCRVGDVSRLDDAWATSPARAAMETAVIAGRDPAVCVLDWMLNTRQTTMQELSTHVDPLMREWAGSVDLGHRLGLADGRRESVGESRTGLFLDDHGFVAEPQWGVHRPSGRLAGRTDFALHREGVMIEFDGMVKYGRLLKPGQTIADVIMPERAREKLLEELTGYWMFRVVWTDLQDQEALRERLDHVIGRAAARHAG
jgi:hypothetical protein